MRIKKEVGRLYVNFVYKFKCLRGDYNDIVGHNYINKSISDEEYTNLISQLYGNKYVEDKYTSNYDLQINNKRWFVDLILSVLDIHLVCDAGANRGYLMEAFSERGIKAFGFDILDSLDVVLEKHRMNYKIGSILDIPKFDVEFDLVTSTDVFEHIPINKIDQMVSELKKLKPRYFCFMISKDMLNDGHITLKNTRWWMKKFEPEYKLMNELTKRLKNYVSGGVPYRYTGIPRNGINQVPGIVFLERKY